MLLFAPYIKLYEKIKFGKRSKFTAAKGVARATARGTKFLIMHSLDDKTVSLANSVLSNVIKNENITLITQKNKGHNSLDSDEAIAYKKRLDDTCYTELGKNPTSTAKREFYQKNADKKIYFEIDRNLMKLIADFYEAGCR
ncbi:MAG: alpha/beta hydrolase, partial [Ruminiclostridium sp.]|nr:alpha/beta hydrolase [Ruminiclostridium sp.]